METFTEVKQFVQNPKFAQQRSTAVNELDWTGLDAPLVQIVKAVCKLPYCFTLQCCYGHFVHNQQKDPRNLEPLPTSDTITSVEYRIAYIALCIDNNLLGNLFLNDLSKIPAIAPEFIQFGCAEWFWKQQLNSFVVQVEPTRLRTKDKVVLPYQQACQVQHVRSLFFKRLEQLIINREITGDTLVT